jgi:hypothetical protein
MDIKQIYREETNLEPHFDVGLDCITCFSIEYVKWLEAKLTLTDDAPSNCVETDNFRVYLPKDDENVVIIEDYFQEKKTIDIVDFNNLMSVLFSVQDY